MLNIYTCIYWCIICYPSWYKITYYARWIINKTSTYV